MLVFELAMVGVQTATDEILLYRLVSLGGTPGLRTVPSVCLKSIHAATNHFIYKGQNPVKCSAVGSQNLISFYISFVVIYHDVACRLTSIIIISGM